MAPDHRHIEAQLKTQPSRQQPLDKQVSCALLAPVKGESPCRRHCRAAPAGGGPVSTVSWPQAGDTPEDPTTKGRETGTDTQDPHEIEKEGC